MTGEELAAIKERVRLYRSYDFEVAERDYDAYVLAESFLRGDVADQSACSDIDALVAEVERLRGQLALDENFRDPEFGGCVSSEPAGPAPDYVVDRRTATEATRCPGCGALADTAEPHICADVKLTGKWSGPPNPHGLDKP